MLRGFLNTVGSFAIAAGIIMPAWAEAPDASKPPSAYHDDVPNDIIVTAPFNRDCADVLSGTSVLKGSNLTRELRSTISPDVLATSFGPNASRPVLRGFYGERIRLLKDGIGSLDVSNTSVDHAVVVNPLTADRIEVLRGPNALRYESAAKERSGDGSVDVLVGGKIVFHVDGGYTKTGNLRTGGFLLPPALRMSAQASPDAAIRDLANLRGDLPNSAART